ncbi:MAG: ABC transporter ATP-binding protein [Chloroflexota bacterium]|nr:ABC transporter ATP-binding protein [Chloroflexota bacterium]MDQ5852676.1 ABC transporter ATP-binding protein [Chloroflexota bacterium]
MEATVKTGFFSPRVQRGSAVATAETTREIVLARGIHKTYDTGAVKTHALRGVDISVERGEMIAIMGPSGCGKTTLLNCLAGLEDFEGGDIYIDGTPLKGMSDNKKTEYRARQMGFVFQSYNLLPVLSAVENVELPLLVSGTSAREARHLALEALDMVAMGNRARNKPAELSGGQRQRVTIARALANKPAIVWADEPTGALDTETADEVMNVILKLNRENGQTFVFVTHDPRIGAMLDRVINMRDGLIV